MTGHPENDGPLRLPAATRSRWQPVRIGLVDLFHYDVEEFHFRDGRLLLRGNNGTGKSKVLALTLPFLLDGDLSARRVEPDGDPGKRMEWNLLLGGDHPHPERLGYTWIEFGRRDPDTGHTHYRTLACGLKAVSGRGIARHWYAVTTQRIDHTRGARVAGTFSLLDGTGTVLSRDRLAEAVAGHGQVYDQAKAYRRAVDEALFGLGEQRYAALVNLLIQLRQPQLSKRPSEAALSRALTEALPPMDQAVIADVADAFRSLDEERDELRAAEEGERAAAAFLDHYRRYAKVASRRRARLPRTEHSRYEGFQRELAAVRTEQGAAMGEREAARERLAALEEAEIRLRAEDAALREGPEMRSAHELEQAAALQDRTAQALRTAAADHEQAGRLHARAQGRAASARQRLEVVRAHAADTYRNARHAAAEACVGLPESLDEQPGPELRRTAEKATERGRRGHSHVQDLATAAEERAAERRAAAARLDEAETDLAHVTEEGERARRSVSETGSELLDAVRVYTRQCVELTHPDPEGLLDALQEWTGSLAGPYPARVHAARAHRDHAGVLADHAARLARREEELRERTAEAEAELGELRSGRRRGPEPPHTRTPGLRENAPGAPLWRLIDFHHDLREDHRAGLEAALEAAGLLDAWVLPDGVLLAADGDVLLAPDSRPQPGTPSLAQCLRPAVDPEDAGAAAVGEAAVARLLAAVGLQDPDGDAHAAGEAAGTWVAPDGRYRVGVLTGRWHKAVAQFIGEGAREAARRLRIRHLETVIAERVREWEVLRAEAESVAGRRRTLDAELAALPEEAPLAQAHARLVAVEETARRAAGRKEERVAALVEATGRADQAAAELTEAAADLGLPADRAGLDAVRAALTRLEVALAALWPAMNEQDDTARRVDEADAEAAEAAERTAEHALRREDAEREATAAEQRHSTLRSTVGAAVAELQQRLADTERALRECASGQRTARERHSVAEGRVHHAQGRIEQLERDLAEAASDRAEAVAALQRFAMTGLLQIALPDLTPPPDGEGAWAAGPAVDFARSVDAALSAVDDSEAAWERIQSRLSEEFKRLQDSLSRNGHAATARMTEDVLVVTIVYQGRERPVPELAEALATEVADLGRILSAHEREVLENHLISEVAGTLQELIGAAERRVVAMNAELENRPTSTGMKLRLVWRPSRKAPPGLAEARGRLRQSADAWTAEDRASVGEFLQAQIARQQADDSAGSRLEHLTAALDYRSWHEFGVERRQSGKWVTATGPASGGERVLAASVPLFAAASSHYASAGSPYAPRLVTLDEAFAGVDDDSRAKCLGLLHAFDLDVVMTSEREWACYPQVPGIAIAQLSRVEDVSAVLVTRWEWDGTARARSTDPVREEVAPPETAGHTEAEVAEDLRT